MSVFRVPPGRQVRVLPMDKIISLLTSLFNLSKIVSVTLPGLALAGVVAFFFVEPILLTLFRLRSSTGLFPLFPRFLRQRNLAQNSQICSTGIQQRFVRRSLSVV